MEKHDINQSLPVLKLFISYLHHTCDVQAC